MTTDQLITLCKSKASEGFNFIATLPLSRKFYMTADQAARDPQIKGYGFMPIQEFIDSKKMEVANG